MVAFSSLAKILGECLIIHSSRNTNFTLLCQDQSTVAQRAGVTVAESSLRQVACEFVS